MAGLVELRLRTRTSEEELQSKVGKILTADDVNVLLTRDTLVRKPNGDILCIYRRGVMPEALRDEAYPILHSLRTVRTQNRGLASGMRRVADGPTRTSTKPIASSIIGYMDPLGPQTYCRTTAWTGRETDAFRSLYPFFQFMAGRMKVDASERYSAQMSFVEKTNDDWVIPGTPFTTITVNNTYPTGVHTDKGDLDEGISALGVLRRGNYNGGWLTFPEFRVAADMRDGDVILMDAHEWHGNTAMTCADCGEVLGQYHEREDHLTERISTVCYYRTQMVQCGSAEEEARRRIEASERRNERAIGAARDA